jgi:hypothetical protein
MRLRPVEWPVSMLSRIPLGHLARLLSTYVRHYKAHRPHREFGLAPPSRGSTSRRPPRLGKSEDATC